MQPNVTAQSTNNTIKRKSEAFTADEKSWLKKYISGFTSLTEAAENLGVSRQVLERAKVYGKSSPDTVEIIRKKMLSSVATA